MGKSKRQQLPKLPVVLTLVLLGWVTVLLAFTLFLYVPEILYAFKNWQWADWTGFGQDSNISQEETLQKGKLTVTKRITHYQSGKTLWDWLGLAGIIAIPVVLFQFQQQQQKRSDDQAKVEKEIADTNLREEALQDYIDKIAELLIDKELKVLLKKSSEKHIKRYEPKLDAILDIARARTLSILRRLGNDGERKGSVVLFLIDAELDGLDFLKNADLRQVNFKGVKLQKTNIERANLTGANLTEANLTGANLTGANLTGANLTGANLTKADLTGANLTEADFFITNLTGADLTKADLTKADLFHSNLTGANLTRAKFLNTNFTEANLTGANLTGSHVLVTNFTEANLTGANLTKVSFAKINLRGANLLQANLKGITTIFINPEQMKKLIKTAKNWEQADYDTDFRNQLGLEAVSKEM